MKSDCCGQWICDDEVSYRVFSYARNSCARNHRRFTLCGYHYAEEHLGRWQDCRKCRQGFETELYVYYGTNKYNFEALPDPPTFKPTLCHKCGTHIRLGRDAYSRLGEKYLCANCGPTIRLRRG